MSKIDWDSIKKSISDILDHIGPIPMTDEDFDIIQPLMQTMNNQQIINELMISSLEKIREPKLASMTMLISILFIVEGPLAFWVNQFIYYLIKTRHHDLWSEIKREYVKSYDDISAIPLSNKIKFLKEHDFDFIDTQIPRDLRNAIAHNTFGINEIGTVVIKKGKKKIDYTFQDLIEIQNNSLELYRVTLEIWSKKFGLSFDELAKMFRELSKEDFLVIMERARKRLQDKKK